MLRAIKAIKNGEMGQNIGPCTLEFGVSRTTLKDRISGRVIHGTNIGSKPYLTKEEEKKLVDFLLLAQKWGTVKLEAKC